MDALVETPDLISDIDIHQLAIKQQWNDLKKVRAQIALSSVKKAMKRVIIQKEREKKDSIEAQETFSSQVAKQIHFQKAATEYGDANSVTKGIFSPSGDLYITVGSSGEGRIWQTTNPNSENFCTELTTLKIPSKICSVAINPRIGVIPASAPNFLTGSTNGELFVWSFIRDIKQQKFVMKQAHSDRINGLNYFSSGSLFLSSSYDRSWTLWDGKRLSKIYNQKGHQKQIHSSSLHPDESLYFTGDLAGYGMMWDLRTGKGVYEIQHNDSILCSDFHPNGFEIAVSGKSNMISIYDIRRKKEVKKIPAHLKLVSSLKYDQKGYFLASVSHDNSIKLWHGQNYSALPCEQMIEQHKITSVDINGGKLAVTFIDRKWSMLINTLKWKNQDGL